MDPMGNNPPTQKVTFRGKTHRCHQRKKKTNQRQASESVGPRVHPQRARPREPDAKPVKFIGGS